MTRLFLIRHGDVENPQDLLYGRLPGFPLNASGRQQALYHVERFLKCHVHPAVIYTSPLERAQQTAEILSEGLGYVPVKEDARLTEWDTGSWTGHSVERFYQDSGYYDSPMRMDGLELHARAADRMFAVVQEILTVYPNQSAFLVSHRESLASLLVFLEKRPWEAVRELDLPRGSVWEVCFEDGVFVSANLAWKA